MNQHSNFQRTISYVFFCCLVLSSCGRNTAPVRNVVPTSSQTPLPTITSVPSALTATPTVNNKVAIITPDDLFSLPELKAMSTPDSEDFCEHLPPPQIVDEPNRVSVRSGRFVLCSWENWPWMTNTAMDLDTGKFVSKDDEGADIVMQNGHATIDGVAPPFSVHSVNNAQIDGITMDALSYAYCQQDLLSLLNNKIQSVLIVHESSIACIKTTEGKIALIRVEKIYPPNILSVQFSFAVLRDE